MAKRSASEVWAALEEATAEAETEAAIEAVLAMTVEERRRSLEAAGFNVDEVDAKADAVFAVLRLRADARAACDAGRWAECIAKLDEARSLVPASDAAPEVQAMRRSAGQAR